LRKRRARSGHRLSVIPGGLVWNGPRQRWEGLRCAVVEFTKKEGGGITQKPGSDPQAQGER
jgi:hypothetical protein